MEELAGIWYLLFFAYLFIVVSFINFKESKLKNGAKPFGIVTIIAIITLVFSSLIYSGEGVSNKTLLTSLLLIISAILFFVGLLIWVYFLFNRK